MCTLMFRCIYTCDLDCVTYVLKSKINYIYSLSVSSPPQLKISGCACYKNTSYPSSLTWRMKKSSSKVALLSLNRPEDVSHIRCWSTKALAAKDCATKERENEVVR